MSTTFEILISNEIPTFGQVCKKTEEELHKFLSNIGIYQKPKLSIEVETHEIRPCSYHEKFLCAEEHYILICVDDIPHVSINTFQFDEFYRRYWKEDIIPEISCTLMRKKCNECLYSHEYYWNTVRYAGSSVVTNLVYGLLAGSIASLGDGVVFSDDSAWDYNRMPITGDKFLDSYFNPEKDSDKELKDWTLKNIQGLKRIYAQ